MTATVDLPVPPPRLYRYRKLADLTDLEQEIAAIKENFLWCAPYRQMNDPMEGLYESSARLRDSPGYKDIIDKILDSKTQVGICSLCETPESEVMWAHYANNYKGICVEYDVQRLIAGLPRNVHLVRLAYADVPPRIGINETDDTQAAMRRILSQKKSNWAYEREWRVLGPLRKVPYAGRHVVSKIYLGANISYSHKQPIVSALESSGIALTEMTVTGYTHEWAELS